MDMAELGAMVKQSDECPVCGEWMATLFELPRMPITGLYEPFAAEFNDRGYVSQSFLHCAGCSHGKLGTIVPPAILYDHGYAATAKSAGSATAVVKFAAFIMKHSYDADFDCVVDIGGNDGSLLNYFLDKRRIAIDPNASGAHQLVNQFIEDADIDFLKGVSKLICCSHTLEHIERPEALFSKLQKVMSAGDLCAFQFPSLDLLIRDCRIDQIYHEHIHYYSLRSASLLLAKYGFEIVAHAFDASHYGALMLIFRKGLGEVKGEIIWPPSITMALGSFKAEAKALDGRLAGEDWMIGYGASQMLPLLKYWLPNLSRLDYVVDDDPAKHGKRYANFNIEIRPVTDLSGKVMVTAFNTKLAVRGIVQKLFAANARDVIVPFNFL